MALALKRTFRCTGPSGRRLLAGASAPLCKITLRLALRSRFAALRRRQPYSCPPRLGQTNGDGLLRRAGTVFAFSNVFHFFADKLACLRAGRFAFTLIFARAFDWFFVWHTRWFRRQERVWTWKDCGEPQRPGCG
jgi:hypothetical protein